MIDVIWYIILGIGIIVSVILFLIFNKKEKLEEIEENIFLSEKKILAAFEKKKDFLIELMRINNDKKNLKLLKSENCTNLFELEKILFQVNDELNKNIENGSLKINDENKSLILKLNELNDSIEGLVEYYNAKILVYNNKYLKKEMNFLYKKWNFKQKKSFNIRKLKEYNILKD